MFFKGSRYEKVPTAVIQVAGRAITYVTTRFIPDLQAAVGHRVMAGERLDHIAWQQYRDAERFWRIADANRAMNPDDLLEEGAILRVPPSAGGER